MARAISIEGANQTQTPASGSEDRVHELHTRTIQSDGMVFRVSQWKLDDNERAAIAAGADVLLWVSSPQHPTVNISVDGVLYDE